MSPRGLRRLGPQPCPWHQGRSNGRADADAVLAFGPIDQIDTCLKGRTRAGKAAVREHGTAAKPPGPPAAITGAGARNSVGPQGWSGACGSGRTARIPETALLSPCPATGMRPPVVRLKTGRPSLTVAVARTFTGSRDVAFAPGITPLSACRHCRDTPPFARGADNRPARRGMPVFGCGFSPYVPRLDASFRQSRKRPAETGRPRPDRAPDSAWTARTSAGKSTKGSSTKR